MSLVETTGACSSASAVQLPLLEMPPTTSIAKPPRHLYQRWRTIPQISEQLVLDGCEGPDLSQITCFASGASTVFDADGFRRAGYPFGVQIQRVTEACFRTLVCAANEGVRLFIDSGAYSAFQQGTTVDFRYVLDRYTQLVAAVDDPRQLLFIMPDVIGSQEESLRLQSIHKQDIRDFIACGADTVLPMQKGSLTPAEAYWDAIEILGTDDFSVGIPGNKAAFDAFDLTDLLRQCPIRRVHVLGVGAKNPKLAAFAGIIWRYRPDAMITADSNRLRAVAGVDRPMTQRCRDTLEATIHEMANNTDYLQVPLENIDDGPWLPDLGAFTSAFYDEPCFLPEEKTREVGAFMGYAREELEEFVNKAQEGRLDEFAASVDPDEEWFLEALWMFLYPAYQETMAKVVSPLARTQVICDLVEDGIL